MTSDKPSSSASAVAPRQVSLAYATPAPGLFWRRFIPGWRFARRVAQLAFLGLFVYLVRHTEATGEEILTVPVNLFFRLDPLNGAAAMLAGRAFLMAFWPALVLLALTALFGRFFCGWICPLGTLLDIAHRLIRPVTRRTNLLFGGRFSSWRPFRYVLLVVVLMAGVWSFPLVGYVDPFGLLMRGWTIVVDPAWHGLVTMAGGQIESAPAWMQPRLNGLYEYLRAHALPFQKTAYATFGITLGLFAALFALELVARRFWCRYVCPLGGMLGLAGRWAVLRRLPVKDCGKCKATSKCGDRCRMGAFDGTGRLVGESCNLCMDCVADCPSTVARFKLKAPTGPAAPAPLGLSRRGFLAASAVGVALPVVARATGVEAPPPARLPVTLLRPPGVAEGRSENRFLDLCIRCGECLKVCTTNGLQPAALEAGWAGLFSPVLAPRTGYCLVSCTLCGQVCPTGAIPLLSAAAKEKVIIGKAAFDRERCLPWAKGEECICCEEHCPVPEKAIQFHTVKVTVGGKELELQQPYVLQERCIGCGICENKCPVEGEAAIHVYRKDAAPPEGATIGLPNPTTFPAA